jgi:HEAT repeat protein
VVSLKSVKPMPVELWDALEAEATNPLTPYRRNAVECLQIFPDKQTIELLCKIANNPTDPEVGKAAISTLKAMHTAQSAAALEALGKTTPRAA